jgi:hypothetical protein
MSPLRRRWRGKLAATKTKPRRLMRKKQEKSETQVLKAGAAPAGVRLAPVPLSMMRAIVENARGTDGLAALLGFCLWI